PSLLASVPPERVLIVDSSSTDETVDLASAAGFQVHVIPQAAFNHGGTRQLAVNLSQGAEILVFLTQDVVLGGVGEIDKLLGVFGDPKIGAAFGRQLPRPAATPIETHARLFNYPKQSSIRTWENREQFGIKAIFFSNSFAAYRRDALMSVGGFPQNVIFG